MNVNLGHLSDDELIGRVAWLYYVFGLNQGEAAARLGLHRSRVNRLLAEGRDRGLIRVTINHSLVRDFEREQAIARAFKLDFCLATPETGFVPPDSDPRLAALHSAAARRSVGMAGASFLQGKLEAGAQTVGVSWGRTIEQVALHLSIARNPAIKFVSLIGSLTRSSVAQSLRGSAGLRAAHGRRGALLASSVHRRQRRRSRRAHVAAHGARRRGTRVGGGSLSHQRRRTRGNLGASTAAIITADEMRSLRDHGVVCDTLGASSTPTAKS